MFFLFFGRLTITKAQVLALSVATLCLVLAVVAAIGSQTARQVGSPSISTTSLSASPVFTPPIYFPTTLSVANLAAEGEVATENGAFSLGPPDMQSRNGIFKYFGFSNEWQGFLNGIKFNVFAGARNSFEHGSNPWGTKVKDWARGLVILGHTDDGTDEGRYKGEPTSRLEV